MDKLNEILAQTLIALQDKELIMVKEKDNMRIMVYKINYNTEISKLGSILLKGFDDKYNKFATAYSFATEDNYKEEITKLFKKLKEE